MQTEDSASKQNVRESKLAGALDSVIQSQSIVIEDDSSYEPPMIGDG